MLHDVAVGCLDVAVVQRSVKRPKLRRHRVSVRYKAPQCFSFSGAMGGWQVWSRALSAAASAALRSCRMEVREQISRCKADC